MERSCYNGHFELKIDFVKWFLLELYSNENQEYAKKWKNMKKSIETAEFSWPPYSIKIND